VCVCVCVCVCILVCVGGSNVAGVFAEECRGWVEEASFRSLFLSLSRSPSLSLCRGGAEEASSSLSLCVCVGRGGSNVVGALAEECRGDAEEASSSLFEKEQSLLNKVGGDFLDPSRITSSTV